MKVEKREMYPWVMSTNGIHTLSGYTQLDIDSISEDVQQTIKSCSKKKIRGTENSYETYVQINPNKLNGKQKLLTTYSSFKNAYKKILNGLGITNVNDFEISRADFCFNSLDDSFEDYKKLHRLLICCVAEAYKFKNCYSTKDLFSCEDLSVAIKNDMYEMENYNKFLESDGKDDCMNRLEIRSKRLKATELSYDFVVAWERKLSKAITYYEDVQQHYNAELERAYKESLNIKPVRYRTLTDFLLAYQDCIFCKAQLVDLLSRFDFVKNPVTTAENFKKKYKIEYFSNADLKYVVQCLCDNLDDFFNN